MRLLKMAWSEGLEVFLYGGKLNARRKDELLTDGDKKFLVQNEQELITEIKNLTSGKRISGEEFYGKALMEDAAARHKKRSR